MRCTGQESARPGMVSHSGLFPDVLVHVFVILYKPALGGKKTGRRNRTPSNHMVFTTRIAPGGRPFFFRRFFQAVPTHASCMAKNWPGWAQWYKCWGRACVLGKAMADHRRPNDMLCAFPFSFPRAGEHVDSKRRRNRPNGFSWGGCRRAHGAQFRNSGRRWGDDATTTRSTTMTKRMVTTTWPNREEIRRAVS